MAPGQLKKHFKTREGRYTLVSERQNGFCSFNPNFSTKLTLASLTDGEHEGTYLLYNMRDTLNICRENATDKTPLRTISFPASSGGSSVVPTCHAFQAAADGLDLIIGLTSGDVLVTSLQAQLAAPLTSRLAAPMLHVNAEGATDATRVVAAAWLPSAAACDLQRLSSQSAAPSDAVAGAAGPPGSFVAAHASGSVYVYQKAASAIDNRFSLRSAASATGRPPLLTIPGPGPPMNAAAVCPRGALIATASRDGVLRIYELATGALVTGYKSYYGSLLCCEWSGNGQYVAGGGEDDLVALFGLAERCVVAWGEGHSSWVSALAFDAWEGASSGEADARGTREPGYRALGGLGAPAADPVYRLASAGQDCQLLLWDLAVPAEPSHLASLRATHYCSALPDAAFKLRSPRGAPAGGSAHTQPPSARDGPQSSGVGERPSTSGAGASPPRHRVSTSPGHAGLHAVPSGRGPPLLPGPVVGPSSSVGYAMGRRSPGPGSAGALPLEVAPPAARVDMVLTPPIVQIKAHMEPMSSLAFTADALYTADSGGQVKCWRRPSMAEPPPWSVSLARGLLPAPPEPAQAPADAGPNPEQAG